MPEAGDAWVPDRDKLYSELCSNIRATDDISFKLLGFVPLLSGSAIFLLLFKGDGLRPLPVVMLCVAGAAVTAGLFLWEQRNIKTCLIFRDAAAALEAHAELKAGPRGGFIRPYTLIGDPPPEYSSRFRKRDSERIIYAASTLVWVIPIVNLLPCCSFG